MNTPKKSFTSFIRPSADVNPLPPPVAETASGTETTQAHVDATVVELPRQGEGEEQRVRHVTPAGRIRTYKASRELPGITYRPMSEEQWERLKMLALQERRPMQAIVAEAMEAYMKSRGLPW
jgi:hypothetical protein